MSNLAKQKQGWKSSNTDTLSGSPSNPTSSRPIGKLPISLQLKYPPKSIRHEFDHVDFRMTKKILFLLVTLLFTSSAFAGVYKWKDDDGRVHYGDTLPIKDNDKKSTDAKHKNDKADLHIQIEKYGHDNMERAEKVERPEKIERPEKVERPEKIERPEKVERAGN